MYPHVLLPLCPNHSPNALTLPALSHTLCPLSLGMLCSACQHHLDLGKPFPAMFPLQILLPQPRSQPTALGLWPVCPFVPRACHRDGTGQTRKSRKRRKKNRSRPQEVAGLQILSLPLCLPPSKLPGPRSFI